MTTQYSRRNRPAAKAPAGLLTRQSAPRHLRGAQAMLEFVILLPILVFIMVLTIDIGHIIFLANALQDATYASARTGAQVGGACVASCPASSAAQTTFDQAVLGIPGHPPLASVTWKPKTGLICKNTVADSEVTIQATYPITFVTPGMFALVHAVIGAVPALSATGVARCEVSR
jgi:Flp pilus assembly protein TadG